MPKTGFETYAMKVQRYNPWDIVLLLQQMKVIKTDSELILPDLKIYNTGLI